MNHSSWYRLHFSILCSERLFYDTDHLLPYIHQVCRWDRLFLQVFYSPKCQQLDHLGRQSILSLRSRCNWEFNIYYCWEQSRKLSHNLSIFLNYTWCIQLQHIFLCRADRRDLHIIYKFHLDYGRDILAYLACILPSSRFWIHFSTVHIQTMWWLCS